MVGGTEGDSRRSGHKEDRDSSDTDPPRGSLRARRSEKAKEGREGKQGKDARDDGKPEKSLLARHWSTLAVVLVLLLGGFFVVADGGPEVEGEHSGPASSRVTSWQVTAALPDGSSEVLCTDEGECDLDRLWPAVVAGAECSFSGEVWLSTDGNPVFLRGLTLQRINATTIGGDPDYNGTSGHNFTINYHEDEPAQGAGLWVRAFSKHLEVEVPVPCDSVSVTIAMSLRAKTFFGGSWVDRPSVTQLIHEDVSGIAGAMGDSQGDRESG